MRVERDFYMVFTNRTATVYPFTEIMVLWVINI